jgi:hypothetical protein
LRYGEEINGNRNFSKGSRRSAKFQIWHTKLVFEVLELIHDDKKKFIGIGTTECLKGN